MPTTDEERRERLHATFTGQMPTCPVPDVDARIDDLLDRLSGVVGDAGDPRFGSGYYINEDLGREIVRAWLRGE